MEFYSKDEKKIEICRVLLKDNTWSKYRVDRFSNEGAITFETKKQFDSLNELCSFYNIHKVRELGVKYRYNDNVKRKYGIEKFEGTLILN
jgi:hypothetical protein